jgi:ubiquinone/menaquinone biosynthesis C-methylase UbiE
MINRMLARSWMRLVSAGFYLLYNPLAPTYDLVSWLVSLGRWRDWQQVALPTVEGDRVLEVAHGPGHLLLALEQRGFRVTGIDLSPQMGKLALRRLRANSADASILRAPAQNLPFAAHSFDSALATFPTEFIAERRTLRELHRVLRPGGRLLIVPQAQLTGKSLAVRVLEFLFAITGQRQVPAHEPETESAGPQWPLMQERLLDAGFSAQAESVSLPGSEVILVTATRPAR